MHWLWLSGKVLTPQEQIAQRSEVEHILQVRPLRSPRRKLQTRKAASVFGSWNLTKLGISALGWMRTARIHGRSTAGSQSVHLLVFPTKSPSGGSVPEDAVLRQAGTGQICHGAWREPGPMTRPCCASNTSGLIASPPLVEQPLVPEFQKGAQRHSTVERWGMKGHPLCPASTLGSSLQRST